MADVVVILHHAEIARMKSWNGEIGRSITRLANDVVFWQRIFASKVTGQMAGQMHWTRKVYVTGIGFLAGSSAPYTLYPDQGTRPHKIFPRRPGGLLRFYWAKIGMFVEMPKVNHPGSQAQRFLERGMRRALSVWDRAG